MLPVLLAAVLWTDGTLGTVYAAEQVPQGIYENVLSETSDGGDGQQGTGGAETPDDRDGQQGTGGAETPDGGDGQQGTGGAETPDDRDGQQGTGGAETPDGGDGQQGTGGAETPDDRDGQQGTGGAETPDDRDGQQGTGGVEMPDDRDGQQGTGGAETPDDRDGRQGTGGAETPDDRDGQQGAGGAEMPEETTVSENTMEDEGEDPLENWNGEERLGEPPVSAETAENAGIASYSSEVFAAGGSVTRQTPGKADIIARYKAYPWSLDVANSYSESPSTKAPYKAGHLTDKSLENALNLLNFIRYVAGIPADVTWNEDYTQMTQAGALLNCVNGELSHTPARPSGFTAEYDELYEKGRKGCGRSNIAMGYGNISKALLNGWMYDGDSSNVDQMGHRRWVLNPSMSRTGFGAVGVYSAMYAFDSGGSKISDFVAWPAQNMPIELMNGSETPWTLSLGTDYQTADIRKVTVVLRDISKNKSWTFSGSNANGLFKVNLDGYGMPNCIIFRPNSVSYDKASRFQVTVTGLTDKAGNDTLVSYNVNFFSLSDTLKPVQEVILNKNSLHLLKGQEETLFATVKPDNAEDTTLVWNSSKREAATVDQKGKVTAVGVGETEITVTASNGGQANCSVKVSDYSLYSEKLTEDGGTKRLTFDLTADSDSRRLLVKDGADPATDKIQWISENADVASVSTDGTVTPQAVGETVIWVNVADGLVILECEVTVEDSALPHMEMGEDSLTLRSGESKRLRVYFTPADNKWANGGITWRSSDASVVFEIEKEDGSFVTGAETVSGSTVTVTAARAGKATISAAIGDGGKKKEASCEVTVRAETVLADTDIPRPVALTNTQTMLKDVILPEGWSWKEPDTPLAQFAGGKTKKFAALYKPEGAGENILPAERLLEVCFLTVENISLGMRTEEGKEQESTVLTGGQNAKIYVNHAAAEMLNLLDENESYKNNECYKKQRDAILNEMKKNIIWSSSRPDVISVEPAADGGVLTAESAGSAKLAAKGAGSATVKASLMLGRKTFSANVKLTVKEAGGTLTVKSVEHFTRAGGADSDASQAVEKYTGMLSDFTTEKPNQVNSKIALTLPGATKVTAKSGNAKVVAVKASAAEGDGFAVSLIVKAAGTAELTLTGNDAAKTTKTLRLVVGDAEPGLSDESITVNVLQTTGAGISLYPAKSPEGTTYEITSVTMASDTVSAKFELSRDTSSGQSESCRRIIKAKSDTKTGTYKVKIRAMADGMTYELPLTVKVVSKKPSYKVKQVQKLNLFYKDARSLLQIDTDETVKDVKLTGCGDYTVTEEKAENNSTCYYLLAKNATLRSVKNGKMQIFFEGWAEPFTTSFTVGVEKKAPKLTLDTGRVVFYPKAGVEAAVIGIKMPTDITWDSLRVEQTGAKGNYETDREREDQEDHTFVLKGKNLNQAESFKARITLRNDKAWTEPLSCTLNIKVSMGKPAILLEKKTLQLNADAAYRGYDAASTAVKWKDGGMLTVDQGVRVSVYCDPKDAKSKNLVSGSQVVFSVKNARVCVRLNNKAVEPGTYKYIVQAAKNGQIWKTPLTLKVVNTAPGKAVKITAKGSIDVLNRDGSFMTLTPSLKSVSGEFVIPAGREVKLTGRDAHLFRASWSEDGKTIALRAKRNETLVINYQYTVTPLLTLRNVSGVTEETAAPAVKFKVKQGSAKVSASPKTALMYSGAYNSVEIDMSAVLKGADAPEIERVALTGNTDAFTYVYNKDGKGTLTMKDTGRAVKGKNYSLQFKVSFAEQADNVKPVTVRVTVKVK